jgi:hypothetical protein
MNDRDRNSYRPSWIPWAITSMGLVLVAIVAYGVGTEHAAVVAGEPVRRAWFFGFPGFWLFFLLFWFLFGGLRRAWWGYPYRPWRYRRYYDPMYDDAREEWEEWHRRAHARMSAGNVQRDSTPPTSDPTGHVG